MKLIVMMIMITIHKNNNDDELSVCLPAVSPSSCLFFFYLNIQLQIMRDRKELVSLTKNVFFLEALTLNFSLKINDKKEEK